MVGVGKKIEAQRARSFPSIRLLCDLERIGGESPSCGGLRLVGDGIGRL